LPERDTYVTRLIPLRYVDATDISNSLKPLVSRDASMIPYGPTNTIILSDTAYVINKIIDIIRQVDIASYQETLEIIVLKFADAGEIAEEITQVFGETQQAAGGGGGGVRRIRQAGARRPRADRTQDRHRRADQLADHPGEPRQIDDIRSLIRRLDYQTPGPSTFTIWRTRTRRSLRRRSRAWASGKAEGSVPGGRRPRASPAACRPRWRRRWRSWARA
jgi:general secretion pathway protein D